MTQTLLEEKKIENKNGEVIVVISADSIRKAFKKVKEDVNILKGEIVELKRISLNQAEVIREILDKLEDINKIKSKIGELEAVVEFKRATVDDNLKKILTAMSEKINYLYSKINELEKENKALKEENEFLKRTVVSLRDSLNNVKESKEEVY